MHLTAQRGTHEVVRERRDLLHARDRDVVDALVLALLEEGVVDLAGTQHMPPDLLGSDQVFGVGVGDVALEVRLARHLGEVGAGLGVTEKRFREEEDELENDVRLTAVLL